MLSGRLGLETARVPHVDRHGLLWLSRGNLRVRKGTLFFVRKKSQDCNEEYFKIFPEGEYDIPFQTVSMILIGPGTTISHDVLRLLARHGTALVAVGDDGVRSYTAPPLMSNRSEWARKQIVAWHDTEGMRKRIIHQMYEWRFGEVLQDKSISALRGIEGVRAKRMYKQMARQYGIEWHGRHYDRQNPDATDLPNQAINHCATAVEAAAIIAVYATSTIAQLGFIHEDAGIAFVLDIADLYRDRITLPCAFKAASVVMRNPSESIEHIARRITGVSMSKKETIHNMIDNIKHLFSTCIINNENDSSNNQRCRGAISRVSSVSNVGDSPRSIHFAQDDTGC